ncbi:MAG: MBL fold metallo-hydrolase [Clostridia bacterium]|nr:MBL fold metallo-hydrolase [Clostridia bacterium]
MKITFYGATESVTGSLYYIETEERNFIVDCGLYQGTGQDLALNKEMPELPYDQIDFVILTHAHIDHCGRLPLLFKNGARSKIYCTEATAHLSELLLRDSASVIEAENELENAKRVKAGLEPIEAFITEDDVNETVPYFYPISYDKIIREANLEIQFFDAGHLLGSASVRVKNVFTGKSIVFSGDIGSGNNPLLNAPTAPPQGTYILTESTYGDREHQHPEERIPLLAAALEEELRDGQTVIIPSFAVGRTQELLFDLIQHYRSSGQLEQFLNMPIYVDSPLAKAATTLFKKEARYMQPAINKMIESGIDPFYSKNITIVGEMKDSIRLAKDNAPKIIISSSGMCQGGRIIGHLKEKIESDKTTLIFVGYQGEWTIGRRLLEKEATVEIEGKSYTPQCKIIKLSGFSGHGDRKMIKSWLNTIQEKKHIFITHGEEEARFALELYLEDLATDITIPKHNTSIEIED